MTNSDREVRPESAPIVVISAPSGAGKTTIARMLLERHPAWRFSVSATTRPIRAGEVEGSDYYFRTNDEFDRLIQDGEVVEWEEIFGNRYGTLKKEILRLLDVEKASRVIFDVDVKGALSIRKAFPQRTLLIFIAPPSIEELKRRLESRRTETEEVISRRLQRAEMELQMKEKFDLVVINDQVKRAVTEIEDFLCPEPAQ